MELEGFVIDTWQGAWRSTHGAFRMILDSLEQSKLREEAIMASIDDLNARLAQVQTNVQALADRVAALGSGSVDVPQGTLDTIDAIDAAVNAIAPAPAQ